MAIRDKTKYSINDSKTLAKNRFVLEFIKLYLNNKNANFTTLKNIFLDELQGSTGVINRFEDVLLKYENHKNKRHFLKDNEILESNDGIKFVISTEWNITNVQNIVKIAENEGFEVIEVLKR